MTAVFPLSRMFLIFFSLFYCGIDKTTLGETFLKAVFFTTGRV